MVNGFWVGYLITTAIFGNLLFIVLCTTPLYIALSSICIYLLAAIVILLQNTEFVSVLLVLVYGGGVLILILICLVVTETKKQKATFINTSEALKFTLFFFILTFFFVPIIICWDCSDTLAMTEYVHNLTDSEHQVQFLKKLKAYSLEELDYHKQFCDGLIYETGAAMYLVYFVPTLLCILLLLIVFICTIIIFKKHSKTITNPKVITAKKKIFFMNFLTIYKEVLESFYTYEPLHPYLPLIAVFMIILILNAILFNFVYNFNFIKFILLVELFLIPCIFLLIFFSKHWGNIEGIILIMYLLVIFASESIIGLSLYVIYKENQKKKHGH